MAPALAKTPPAGADWIHEVKFDGWRAQIHVEGGSATIYSKNGADYTKRFRALRSEGIPAKSAIIDCELVACDETGMPCFRTLMELGNKAPGLCLWCFDLLSIDGARITPLPLQMPDRDAQDKSGRLDHPREVRVGPRAAVLQRSLSSQLISIFHRGILVIKQARPVHRVL